MDESKLIGILQKQAAVQRAVILLQHSCGEFLNLRAQGEIANIQAQIAPGIVAANALGQVKGPDEKSLNIEAAAQLTRAAQATMGNILMMCNELVAMHQKPQTPRLAE